MGLTIDQIKELMDKMAQTGLTSVELKEGDVSLKLKSEQIQSVVVPMQQQLMPVQQIATAVAEQPKEAAEAVVGNIVKSPIVGTFYLSPAPDKAPFIKEGSKVSKGDVLFIIESMKLMNEITSEYNGVVQKILIENGQGVEYGQELIIIA